MKNITCLLFLLLFTTLSCFAQRVSYSEIKAESKMDLPDTSRVKNLTSLASYFIDNKGESAKDSIFYLLNSAYALSNEINYTRGKVFYFAGMAKAYVTTNEIQKARTFATKAINLAKKSRLTQMEALCYMQLSNAYTGEDKALEYAEQSIKAARKFSGKEELAELLGNISGEYYNFNKFSEGIACGEEAVRLYSTLHIHTPDKIYGNLADGYNVLGMYDMAIKYGLKAIKEGEKNGSTNNNLFYYYNTVGDTYNYLKNYKTSENYSRKALDYAIKDTDIIAIYTAAYSVFTDMYSQPGRTKETKIFINKIFKTYQCDEVPCKVMKWSSIIQISDKLGETAVSEKYCMEMLRFADKNRESIAEYHRNAIYNSAMIHYYKIKNYTKARFYLNIAKPLAKEMGLAQSIRDNYRNEFLLDSVQGNLTSAIKNYQAYIRIKDSLFNEIKSNQISHYQTEYESVKKDNNIQLLTKEGLLQKAVVENERRTIVVVILLLGLVVVIAGALYWRNRNRKKHNDQLQVKQLEIEAKNKSLGKLVTEKEWLLKEIHHRVKNNLQIVMSLLNSQSHYLKDKAALTAIRDSQHRVNSISLIHQKLYQSENLASIGMVAYIHDLVSNLKDSFDTGNIIFEVKVDNIDLDVSQAVPVGLILNEAITNAMKYAFKDRTNGKIKISLAHKHDEVYELIIRDNGIGMPDNYDISESTSLGMTLIRGLSEDLDGEFTIHNNNGTVIKTSFIKDCFLDNRDACETA
ncbi:tetratricopeptide repeat-containing sensor histidine kinase [Flavobacterium rivuli]|uniref:tetratricopeptide repeat-containing sensor histidine kinase n=1 Tax=Flavobacterium rivuli TaxID=498301 RepID=UPI000361C498|nr:histidine kinase dimerization/phosphoacceptor domain -containing protein [Flavobacterium rivuli]